MRRYGGDRADWLDLSTGINPWAWPWPAPRPTVTAAAWANLPDRRAEDDLCAAARAAYDVPAGIDVVAAPGTQALIQWLPRLAAAGDVAILAPTYGEHESSWASAGHRVVSCRRPEDLPAAARHVVVVSPNNPDGGIVSDDVLAEIARRTAVREGWLVVDAAFAEAGAAPAALPGAIVLRSFGKFYGLAGLRLGFALAPLAVADTLRRALGPWSVGGPAMELGTAALRDPSWTHAMREKLDDEAARLDGVLAAGGCVLAGGTALFRLVRHPEAAALQAHLASRHIWCRRFADAPDFLRFGLLPSADASARLRAALT